MKGPTMTATDTATTTGREPIVWDGPIQPVNPTTLEHLAPLQATPAAELNEVIERADAAFATWRVDGRVRAQALRLWADGLRAEASSLADDLVIETGKPLREAHTEISSSIDCLEYNAGLARHLSGSTGLLPDGTISHLVREPVGVSTFLVPWNWPILLMFRDLSPALAAGTTAIVKPAPQTSRVTRRVAEIGYSAGIPRDVVTVVFGDVAVAQHLLRHRAVRAVAFTGSTRVGEVVLASAARNMVRPLLELGGKNAAVVLPDAHLETALPALAKAALITSGQMCMACSRLLVHRAIFDEALSVVKEVFAGVTIGNPADPGVDMGPLISPDHARSVTQAISEARNHNEVFGGDLVHPADLAGHFVTPTIVAGPSPDAAIVNTDVFGPVLTIETFDDDDSAVALANATEYGLVAGVWSSDAARAMNVARQIKAGTVWINGWGRTYVEVPAGGFKSSGLGRTRGVAGLEQFTELKHIHLG